MGKRKVSILEPAATAVAEIAWFIESKGLPRTAKNFVIDAFDFFDKLSDERLEHKPCTYEKWKTLGYRCVSYKKKYVVAYLSQQKEIVICDFVAAKLLR
jgi:hypothetical protein